MGTVVLSLIIHIDKARVCVRVCIIAGKVYCVINEDRCSVNSHTLVRGSRWPPRWCHVVGRHVAAFNHWNEEGHEGYIKDSKARSILRLPLLQVVVAYVPHCNSQYYDHDM